MKVPEVILKCVKPVDKTILTPEMGMIVKEQMYTTIQYFYGSKELAEV